MPKPTSPVEAQSVFGAGVAPVPKMPRPAMVTVAALAPDAVRATTKGPGVKLSRRAKPSGASA